MGKSKSGRTWTVEQHHALREAIKEARRQSADSQKVVSEAAGVALRTVASLEAADCIHKPRREILVRLAIALGMEPNALSNRAGYPALPERRVERIADAVARYPTRRETDPRDFFSSIRSRISDEKPVLFCVAYSAAPGTAHRADVKSLLVDLIDRGMWLAMVVPYPAIDPEKSSKPNLANFLRHIHGQVVATAFELSAQTLPAKRDRIAVFVPSIDDTSGATLFATPPISSTETRSALIKWYGGVPTGQEFELGAWVTFANDRRDLWFTVFSRRDGQRIGEDNLSVLPAWKDYFRDIIDSFDSARGKGWGNKTGAWRRVQFQAS